jgi:hypothetical protein
MIQQLCFALTQWQAPCVLGLAGGQQCVCHVHQAAMGCAQPLQRCGYLVLAYTPACG